MANSIIAMKVEGGFSLVEMAVVLVILGFVIGVLMLPLQAQRENTFRLQTENQLEIAKKALIGFAQAKGRLPCPAIDGATATAAPQEGGQCAQQLGFLPVATLGIATTTDQDGYAIDAWNNRIMYAVTQTSVGGVATPDFTTLVADDPATPAINEADGMNVVGIAALAPNLRVCKNSSLISGNQCSASPETNYLVNNAVAVIYSYGATAAQDSGGSDENANFHADPTDPTLSHNVFVFRQTTAATPAMQEFDHLMVWISPYVLYNAMIQAGQLH